MSYNPYGTGFDPYSAGTDLFGAAVARTAQQSAPSAAPANSQTTDPNAPGYFVAEDDFVVGQDGNVYQRQREGFRTIGWKPLGSATDMAAVIQAAGPGMNVQVLTMAVQKQQNELAQQQWLQSASGVSGLNQQQLEQQAQASANQAGLSESQWKLAMSAGDPTLTNEQYQQKLQGQQNIYQTGEVAHDLSTQTAQHAYQDLQRQYGTQEDQYNLANIAAQHNLLDIQRNLNTQQSTWQLAHIAQTQANDAYHLTQQGYENQKASSDRDTAGMGYSGLANPHATALVGQ